MTMWTEQILELQHQADQQHYEAERQRLRYELQQQFMNTYIRMLFDQYAEGMRAAWYRSLNPHL